MIEPILEGGTSLAQRHIPHQDGLDKLRETEKGSARFVGAVWKSRSQNSGRHLGSSHDHCTVI
jgi:hypothetical protein